jgi:hypothetical protein
LFPFCSDSELPSSKAVGGFSPFSGSSSQQLFGQPQAVVTVDTPGIISKSNKNIQTFVLFLNFINKLSITLVLELEPWTENLLGFLMTRKDAQYDLNLPNLVQYKVLKVSDL